MRLLYQNINLLIAFYFAFLVKILRKKLSRDLCFGIAKKFLPLIIIFSSHSAFGANLPDAGQTLQQIDQQKTPQAPISTDGLFIEEKETKGEKTKEKKSEPQVMLKSITIHGNKIFSEKELLKLVGGYKNKKIGMSELQELTGAITEFYHKHGYSFAKAIMPSQSLKNGELTIEILEGYYGDVKILSKKSEETNAKEAVKFLSHLKSGDIIKPADIERASLILSDIPGYKFVSVVGSGKKAGTADLAVAMQRVKKVGGNVTMDNAGNRFTGAIRGMVGVYANSVLRFGDQITANVLQSQGNLWYGTLGYNMPIGYSGLRSNFSYSRADYELGKEYAVLGSHGRADILSAGLKYPIIRSKKSNLSIAATYNHKWFTDNQDSVGTTNKKSSNTLPIALNFDKTDNVFGGGVTYGLVSWTHGILDLGKNLNSTDNTGARSNGNFDKFNFDASRLQSLPVHNLSFFARTSGQVALNNLDSSERFGLGGPNAVRAYPTGESYGDEGIIGQAELRYAMGNFSPFALYDLGHIKTSHSPFSTGANQRTIGGAGFGLRFNQDSWNATGSIAWRTVGSKSLSDNKAKTPTMWFNVGYSF